MVGWACFTTGHLIMVHTSQQCGKKDHETSALEVKLTVVTALSITAGFCIKLVKESEWAKLLA